MDSLLVRLGLALVGLSFCLGLGLCLGLGRRLLLVLRLLTFLGARAIGVFILWIPLPTRAELANQLVGRILCAGCPASPRLPVQSSHICSQEAGLLRTQGVHQCVAPTSD